MKYKLLIILILFNLTSLMSQELNSNFKILQSQNNISQFVINDTLIYFSTGGGLVIRNINGKLIKNDSLNSKKINGYITKMAISPDKKLWINLSNGTIRRFNGKQWDSPIPDSLKIRYFNFDEKGKLWLHYFYKYSIIGIWENGNLKKDTIDKGYNPEVNFIVMDKNETYWCGAGEYLYTKKGNSKWTKFPGITQVYSAVKNPKTGNLWFLNDYQGLNEWDGVKFNKYKKDSNGLIIGTLNDIAFDSNGDMWLSGKYGIQKWNYNSSLNHFREINTQSLINRNMSIGVDKNDNFWLVGDGIHNYKNKKWTSYFHDGIPFGEDIKYTIDNLGKLYIANNTERLAIYFNGIWKYYNFSPNRPKAMEFIMPIVGFAKTKDNKFFIAASHGLYILNDSLCLLTNDFANQQITSVSESKNGDIFLSTKDDIYFYDTGKWIKLNIGLNSFKKILKDKKENIWIIPPDLNGLIRIKKGGIIERLSTNETLSKTINNIFEDVNGNIWLATDKGVAIYDSIKWSFISKDQMQSFPLNKSNISDISQDINGNMWFLLADNLGLIKMKNNKYEVILNTGNTPYSIDLKTFNNYVYFNYRDNLIIYEDK